MLRITKIVDADTDNVYVVEINATDNLSSATQVLRIEILMLMKTQVLTLFQLHITNPKLVFFSICQTMYWMKIFLRIMFIPLILLTPITCFSPLIRNPGF